MRIEGTLAKWNDDRGFGFITPTQAGPEVFAHISAFPRDGQRPRLGERLSFEIGTGKDGKKQAKNILFSGRPTERLHRLSMPSNRRDKPGLFVIPLVFLVTLGAYGYGEYTSRVNPQTVPEAQSSDTVSAAESSDPVTAAESIDTVTAAEPSVPVASASFNCDGRTHCSQMTSCAEAEFFLRHCPNVEMDGNHDGEPCEQQWCN